MVKITGEYQGDLHCTAVHEPSGNSLATDAPRDNQGRGEAFSPTDLVATAFGTCIATTIRFEVTKEMSTDAPRRISRLYARLFLPLAARGVPEGLLERTANSCPVHKSLAPELEKVIELVWE